jgi:addiction module HigA family antidote
MANEIENMYSPDFVSPPGETLEELLEDRGMRQAELAERMGRPRKTINEIIQGKAAITAETALQLERVLGTPARFWLEREQHYREFLARQSDEAQLTQQIGWLNEVPLSELIQCKLVAARAEPVAQLREVLAFYGIASPAQYTSVPASFRRSSAFQSDSRTIVAWLRQGERLALDVDTAPFDEVRFRNVLGEARALTRMDFQRVRTELPTLCAQAGVAVVIVPELPRTRVCGATRWLAPTKALIQLSLRYKTDDQFWFTFFHEAAHILLHGKRSAFIDEDAAVDDAQEHEANAFARDLLIQPADLARLRARRKGYYSADLVKRFAAEIGIAPGIVVGRLQHNNELPRTHLNGLKRRLIPNE